MLSTLAGSNASVSATATELAATDESKYTLSKIKARPRERRIGSGEYSALVHYKYQSQKGPPRIPQNFRGSSKEECWQGTQNELNEINCVLFFFQPS